MCTVHNAHATSAFYTEVRDDARDEARESCSLTTLPAALAAELPLVGGPAATFRTCDSNDYSHHKRSFESNASS